MHMMHAALYQPFTNVISRVCFFFPRLFCCSLLYSDFLLFLKCQGRCTENLFLPFQLLMQDLG